MKTVVIEQRGPHIRDIGFYGPFLLVVGWLLVYPVIGPTAEAFPLSL